MAGGYSVPAPGREQAKPPTRATIRQWGVRYSTGIEHWYYVDLQYGNFTGGGNGTTREQVVATADRAVDTATKVGLELTYKILYRDHLTTTWSRWTRVEEED